MNPLSLPCIPTLRTHKIPLFIILFLCFAVAILCDSTAEALLLANYSARMIPKMYLVNALFLFLLSAFAMSIIDRVDRGMFFLSMVLGHGAILLLVWVCVLFRITFIFILLFSYAYVSKILLFLMFWTLANDLIDSRKAGDEFPFIAAGGTLGAILISLSIPWLLRIISARSLLPVLCVLCIVLALFFFPLQKSFGKHFISRSDKAKHGGRTLKSCGEDLKLIRREPLLWNMSILYFILFFILLNQQYGFYSALKGRFSAAEDMAAFIGYFNGISMAATFTLQMTLAGPILKKIGSTRSMFLLPAVLCIVCAVLAVLGIFGGASAREGALLLFWATVIGLGLRIASFDSFFSPNFQVFFSSLPQDIRGRGKLTIEGVIKPIAIAFSSFWLMTVAPRLGFGYTMAILFVLAAAMIVQTFRLRATYTESLTRYLSGLEPRTMSSFMNSLNAGGTDNIIVALEKMLESEPFEVKSFIIEILAEIGTEESINILRDFVPKTDDRTRSKIVVTLGRMKRMELKPLFSSLLSDKDGRVVADAILGLGLLGDQEINEGLAAFVRHPHRRVKANAVIAVWPMANAFLRKELRRTLEELLVSSDSLDCAAGLYALGEIHAADEAEAMLKVFLGSRADVLAGNRNVWRQFLAAAGKNPGAASLDMLLELAYQTSTKRRADIAAAIAAMMRAGYAVDDVLGRIAACDDLHRSVLVHALYIFAPPMSREAQERLAVVAADIHRDINSDWLAYAALEPMAKEGKGELVQCALRELHIDGRIETLIHIAALLDATRRIRKVSGRLYHENMHVRARALEVLDNVGNMRVNKWIIGLLDSADPAQHIREARGVVREKPPDAAAVIARCRKSAYPWVRLCAQHAAGALQNG